MCFSTASLIICSPAVSLLRLAHVLEHNDYCMPGTFMHSSLLHLRLMSETSRQVLIISVKGAKLQGQLRFCCNADRTIP